MSQKNYRSGSKESQKRRREEVAYLYLDGWNLKEISEYSGYSVRTIQRDIEYIKTHKEEFFI